MEQNTSKTVSQTRMYTMMGLGIAVPIMIYFIFQILWKNTFMLRENSVAGVVALTVIIGIAMVVLYIVDIVKVASETGKVAMLIVLFLFFQPAYFVYRQSVLKCSTTGSIVYMVVTILEPIFLVISFVLGILLDIGKGLQGLGQIG